MNLELIRRTATVAGMLRERFPGVQITTVHTRRGCVGFMWSEIPAKNTITVQVTESELLYAVDPALIVDCVAGGWPKS